MNQHGKQPLLQGPHQHEWVEEIVYYTGTFGETYKIYRCDCGEIGYPVYDG